MKNYLKISSKKICRRKLSRVQLAYAIPTVNIIMDNPYASCQRMVVE